MPASGEHHPAFEEYCECIFELRRGRRRRHPGPHRRAPAGQPAGGQRDDPRLESEGLVTIDGGTIRSPTGQRARPAGRPPPPPRRAVPHRHARPVVGRRPPRGRQVGARDERRGRGGDGPRARQPHHVPARQPDPRLEVRARPTSTPLARSAWAASVHGQPHPRGARVHPGLLDFLEESSIQPGHVGVDHRRVARRHRHRRDRRPPRGRRRVRQRAHPGRVRACTRRVRDGADASARAAPASSSALLGLRCSDHASDDSRSPELRRPRAPTTDAADSAPCAELLPRLADAVGRTLSATISTAGEQRPLQVVERDRSTICGRRAEPAGRRLRPARAARRLRRRTVAKLAERPVQFNRAADADKAAKNLRRWSTPTSPDASPHVVRRLTARPVSAMASGSGCGVDDGQALGAAGERDVEGAQALLLVRRRSRRLDHDDAVELEALDDADRHHGDADVEPGARGPAVVDAGGGERRRTSRRPSRRARRRRCCRRRSRCRSAAVPRRPLANSSPGGRRRRTPAARRRPARCRGAQRRASPPSSPGWPAP